MGTSHFDPNLTPRISPAANSFLTPCELGYLAGGHHVGVRFERGQEQPARVGPAKRLVVKRRLRATLIMSHFGRARNDAIFRIACLTRDERPRGHLLTTL
mgnify:CR=1 FL=1